MTARKPIAAVPDPPVAPQTRGRVLDHAVGVYDWLSPAMMFWQEKRINRRLISFLEIQPGFRVLDVGCATGGMALALGDGIQASAGGVVIGIDASPRMVASARKKIGDRPCRFDVGVAEKLPYPAETFDAVVSSFFFHHLNLEDKLSALREVWRVLKPAGQFAVADVDVPTTWFGKISAYSGCWVFRQPEIAENIEGKLVPLFAEAGFVGLRRCAHNLGYVTTFLMRK